MWEGDEQRKRREEIDKKWAQIDRDFKNLDRDVSITFWICMGIVVTPCLILFLIFWIIDYIK